MGSIRLAVIDDPRMSAPLKEEWQDDALCAQVGSEVFFPPKGGSTLDGKMVCKGCYVIFDCLIYAMANEHSSNYGIFGGLSERERKKLQKIMAGDPLISLEDAYDRVVLSRKQKGNRKQNRPVRTAAEAA